MLLTPMMTMMMVEFLMKYFCGHLIYQKDYFHQQLVFRTSQVWARVRNGVGEKMAMLGDGWGDFFQKCFDQWDDVDGNKNGHLGHWEGWLKGTMFNFMTIVTGQGVNDKFKQSAPTFRSQFNNTKNTTTNNNTTRNGG
ncbi:243_t:CDS:2 [Entrophospora sp. SA101]|nr:243_t:CDS:2 [Entrophospora sp. SA101]